MKRQHLISIALTTLLSVSLSAAIASAQVPGYKHIPLQVGKEINDTLSDKDIPLGEEGFAKEYEAYFRAGEIVLIELTSDSFDTIATLLGDDGAKVAENDDSSEGNTNSVLFWRFTKSGKYIIRVHAFSPTGSGPFTLKVTRMRPE